MAYSISDLLQSILELSPQDSTTAAATQNTDADHSNRRAFGSEMASGVVYPPVPTGGFISSDSTRDALDQNDTHFLEQSTHTWAHRSLPPSGLQPQGAIIHVSHPNSHRSTLPTAASSSHPTSIPGARAIGSHLWMPDHPSAGPSSKKSSLRPSPSQHDGSSLQEPAFGGGATLGDNPAVAPSPSSNTRRPGTGVQHSHPTSQPPQSFASLSHPLSQPQSPAGYYRQDYTQPSTSPTYMPSLYGPTPVHPQFSPHSLSHQHQQRHSYASSPYGLGQSPAPPMISQHHSFQQPYTHPSGMVGVPLPPELGVNMPDRYSSVMSHMPMYPRGPYSPHSLAGESPSTSLDAGRPPSPSTTNRQRGAPMVPPVTTFQPQSNHSNPAISNPPNSPHAPPGSTGYHYASTTSPTYAPFFPYHLAGSPAQPSVPFSPYGHGSYYGTQHSPDDGPPVPHPGPPAQPQSGGWWYMPPQAQQPGGAGGGSPYEYSGAYFGYPVDVAGGHIMSPGMVSMHQISSVAPSGHNPQRSNHVPIAYPHPPIVHTHSPTGTFSRDVAGPGGNQPPPSGKSDNQPDGTTVPHSELGPERTPAAEGPSPRRTSKSPRQKTPTDDPKENATSEMQSAHSTTQSGRPQSQRGQGQRRFGRQQQTSQQMVPATKKGKAGSPIRRAYHPNPPTQRSEWVMWVGNVPADATQDELWRFFNDPFRTSAGSVSIGSRGSNTGEEVGEGGVSSVFLISQSNCAFVNFDSQSNLERAIATFNGRPLRSSDPRCPKLVCRIRRKDDDLRAGVGGQRGMGMHTQWIKAQAEAMRRSNAEEATKIKGETKVQGDDDINVPSHFVSHDEPPTSPSSHLGPNSESGLSPASARGEIDTKRNRPVLAPLDPSVRLAQSRQQSSTSSGSYASTTSSFLTQYFPQRYFILKSLTEADLHMSVERGVWATQPHNEPILDQAFRTSTDVFLIFGANKTGEFFGYARMVGPITKGELPVTWSSRTDSGSSRALGTPKTSRSYPAIVEEPVEDREDDGSPSQPNRVISPSPISSKAPAPGSALRILEDRPYFLSPAQMGPEESTTLPSPEKPQNTFSAPAVLGPPTKKVTFPEPTLTAGTFDLTDLRARQGRPEIKLNPIAPINAMRSPVDRAKALQQEKVATAEEMKQRSRDQGSSLAQAVIHAQYAASDAATGESWGTPFAVQWIKMERLPFSRTKHLRNRWNYDREIKVSRDGTELEPSVGTALLREWDRLHEEPAPRPSKPERARGFSDGQIGRGRGAWNRGGGVVRGAAAQG